MSWNGLWFYVVLRIITWLDTILVLLINGLYMSPWCLYTVYCISVINIAGCPRIIATPLNKLLSSAIVQVTCEETHDGKSVTGLLQV